MKQLIETSDFAELSPNEKIHRIFEGEIQHYNFVSIHPRNGMSHYIIVYSDANYSTTHVFNIENANRKYEKWFSGKYNSKIVGEEMVSQLEDKIKSVSQIYIKETI